MESIKSVFNSFFEVLPSIWNLKIFAIDGSDLTFGKLLSGILLLVVGYFICKKLSKQFGNKVLSRLDVDTSIQHTLQTLSFYFLLIILVLFILRLINVPVTVFTVLGGALALGVGFGSQNIVNNFISGIILMVERPVRVGDIIQVQSEGLRGTIEHIGGRSTMIKSMDNTHFVVPNSYLLEKNVLNWTLSDDVVREKVSVGVAYGSDTDLVKKTLMDATVNVKKVLHYPEPVILFAEFGDSSLNFELYFWTRVGNVFQVKKVASDIRYEINKLFAENKIEIAFPQLDVHMKELDSSKPFIGPSV